MNEKKQTAVDWLVEKMSQLDILTPDYWQKEIAQAKAIEKQQIVEAYQDGRSDQHSNEPQFYNRNSEYYYSQTYNQ